jgi:riboflavin kinase, archaea type
VPETSSSPRLKSEELQLLRSIAAAGGNLTPVVLTSKEAGHELDVSQQAADRYLVHLAAIGYVTRTLAARRQRVMVTPAGLERLRHEYHSLRRIFEGPGRLRFSGIVVSGLGEGGYYLSQPGYVIQFSERLGYKPYPGTLNVRLSPREVVKVGALQHWKGVRIDGYQASGRTFGGATCYAARLNGRDCHLIAPDRSHYQDVVEFIAPVYLRGALHLKDQDRVMVELDEA